MSQSYFYEIVHHSVEKRVILSHQNFFREINSFAMSLVKTLLSRNFINQKCERESP